MRLESPFYDFDPRAAGSRGQERSAAVPVDAYRRGDAFYIHVDLPGVDPSTVDLTVDQNTLTVSAERNWPSLEGDETIISERPQGSFRRQFILGESLDVERIAASSDHGVLTIVIPVAARSQPRKVSASRAEADVASAPAGGTDQPKHGFLHRHPAESGDDAAR